MITWDMLRDIQNPNFVVLGSIVSELRELKDFEGVKKSLEWIFSGLG